MCIISTAQQASPNVMGQMDPVRAQFMSASTLDKTNSAPGPPFDVGAFTGVEVAVARAGALVCSIRATAPFRDAACAALGSNDIVAKGTTLLDHVIDDTRNEAAKADVEMAKRVLDGVQP